MPKKIKNPNNVTYRPPKAIDAPNQNTSFSGTAPPMTPAPAGPSLGPLPPGFGTAAGFPSPPPFDPLYEQQVGLNNRNLETQNAGYAQQEQQTLREFGLDDPTDPFSRARLLQQSYQRSVTGATNSMASAGQLYSGALQNAQNRNSRNLLQGQNTLRQQQNEVLGRIRAARAAAQAANEQANITAQSESVGRAVNTPVDPATVPPDPPKKPRLTGHKKKLGQK